MEMNWVKPSLHIRFFFYCTSNEKKMFNFPFSVFWSAEQNMAHSMEAVVLYTPRFPIKFQRTYINMHCTQRYNFRVPNQCFVKDLGVDRHGIKRRDLVWPASGHEMNPCSFVDGCVLKTISWLSLRVSFGNTGFTIGSESHNDLNNSLIYRTNAQTHFFNPTISQKAMVAQTLCYKFPVFSLWSPNAGEK